MGTDGLSKDPSRLRRYAEVIANNGSSCCQCKTRQMFFVVPRGPPSLRQYTRKSHLLCRLDVWRTPKKPDQSPTDVPATEGLGNVREAGHGRKSGEAVPTWLRLKPKTLGPRRYDRLHKPLEHTVTPVYGNSLCSMRRKVYNAACSTTVSKAIKIHPPSPTTPLRKLRAPA